MIVRRTTPPAPAARRTKIASPALAIPPLENGDHLTRDEFERRYDAMPELKKAELIDGVVYMPPVVSFVGHGGPHAQLLTWLGVYRASTPGTECGANSSLRLDMKNMPQPDAFLRIAPKNGGQSSTDADGCVAGAPELTAEVAASSASYDLHEKLGVYLRHRVREYVVWRVWNQAIDWFILRGSKYVRRARDRDGVYRSQIFPGLWLDPAAMIRDDMPAVLNILQAGIATPQHAAFIRRLKSVSERKSS